MASETLDQELAAHLSGLRAGRGLDDGREEVARVVEAIMTSLQGDLYAADLKLYTELEALAEYIQHAREEIAELRPQEIRDNLLPSATDELDAVVGATEEATHSIMDAAEKIESLCPQMPDEVSETVVDAITEIFTACGFQDITGQRITKVVKALKHIESKVEALLAAFSEESGGLRPQPVAPPPEDTSALTEDDLLNGPQLPAEAIKQDEIDKLFS